MVEMQMAQYYRADCAGRIRTFIQTFENVFWNFNVKNVVFILYYLRIVLEVLDSDIST